MNLLKFRRLILLLFPLIAAVSMSACANDQSNDDEPAATYFVNGEVASKFYSYFSFEGFNGCDEPVRKYACAVSTDFQIGDSSRLLGTIWIFIKADGSYVADYQEFEFVLRFPSLSKRLLNERIIEGSWLVSEGKLHLSNLGVATGTSGEGVRTLDLEFDSNLVTDGIEGRHVTLRRVVSDYLPTEKVDPCRAQ